MLGGGGLFAVFPLAYATIMTALYPTIIGMLLALIFRGVAFEFRFRADTRWGRRMWDFAFFTGSTLAALCQGLSLGGLLQGIRVVNRSYAGGWFDWLTPFTVLCGVAVVVGYALLGACWLVWRTEGELQSRVRRQAMVLGVATLALIGIVSVWTPFLNATFMQRWFHWPGIALTSPVPLLVAALAFGFWWGLAKEHHLTPFLCALGVFVLCFAGLGVSMFPLIVPPSITIWGRGRGACRAGVPADRCLRAGAADPGVFGPVVLGVPWQGEGRGALPLMPSTIRRLTWFVGIWAVSVASLAVVAYGLRALIPR